MSVKRFFGELLALLLLIGVIYALADVGEGMLMRSSNTTVAERN